MTKAALLTGRSEAVSHLEAEPRLSLAASDDPDVDVRVRGAVWVIAVTRSTAISSMSSTVSA